MCLSIKIFTGDTTEKYLSKLKRRAGRNTTPDDASGSKLEGRTGHTFKKMIEKYENDIKSNK